MENADDNDGIREGAAGRPPVEMVRSHDCSSTDTSQCPVVAQLGSLVVAMQTPDAREGIDSWLIGLDSPAARAISDSSDHGDCQG